MSTTTLVMQLARFGDLVQTKRLVRSLAIEPHNQVHLVVDHSLVPLARQVYPETIVHGVRAHGGRGVHDSLLLQETTTLCHELQALRPRKVFNLNFSGLNMALAGLFDPEIVRGYRLEYGQGRSDAWAQTAFRLAGIRQAAPLNLVDLWAGYVDEPVPPNAVNPAACARGGGIGVVLAGRVSRRSLDTQTLALLTAAALERIGHGPVLLLGTREEARAARDLQRLLPPSMQHEVRDLTGKTDWQGLVGHLQELDLVLTPDTGTMHLAAHLGVPVMAFFLASAWCHETGPYGQGHLVVQASPPCAPCREGEPCGYHQRCKALFTSRFLLRYVSGRSIKNWPDDLTLFTTDFDTLGIVYTPLAGKDDYKQQRQTMRAWLTAHKYPAYHPHHPPSAETFTILYREKDWMTRPSTVFA